MEPVIYAADIGSIAQGNFGWARLDPDRGDIQVERDHGGAEIRELADAVAGDLIEGQPVALGFECPLFVPVPHDPPQLGAARPGEGSRPFAAGAGTGALVTGMVQTAWILRELRDRCPDTAAFVDWADFVIAGHGLFLWEAFVSGTGKGSTHVDDARMAATAFRKSLPDPLNANAVEAESPLSLVGAALLWSGWSQDTTLLHSLCLVIKAESPAADKLPAGKAARQKKLVLTWRSESLHDWVAEIAAQIPRGRWTTYGLVAGEINKATAEITAIPRAVGGVLRKDPDIPNAHRILQKGGRIAVHYPFPRKLLADEGVRFSGGRADPGQRWPTSGS